MLKKAQELLDIKEKTALVNLALEALVEKHVRLRLINLAQYDKKATTPKNAKLIESGGDWLVGTAIQVGLGKNRRVVEGARTMKGIGLYKVIDGLVGDNVKELLGDFGKSNAVQTTTNNNLNDIINNGGSLQ